MIIRQRPSRPMSAIVRNASLCSDRIKQSLNRKPGCDCCRIRFQPLVLRIPGPHSATVPAPNQSPRFRPQRQTAQNRCFRVQCKALQPTDFATRAPATLGVVVPGTSGKHGTSCSADPSPLSFSKTPPPRSMKPIDSCRKPLRSPDCHILISSASTNCSMSGARRFLSWNS